MTSYREAEIARLEGRIAELRSQPEPEYFCAICHTFPEDTEDGVLTDVRVIVADGEEGFSDVTLLLCDDHLARMTQKLTKLGFIDHRHGSTSSLEDLTCLGSSFRGRCPTPTEYGNVTWGRNPPQVDL